MQAGNAGDSETSIQEDLAALHSQLDRIEQALQEILARLPKSFDNEKVMRQFVDEQRQREARDRDVQ